MARRWLHSDLILSVVGMWLSPLMRPAPWNLVRVIHFIAWAGPSTVAYQDGTQPWPSKSHTVSNRDPSSLMMHHGKNYGLTKTHYWIWGLAETSGLRAGAAGLILWMRSLLFALDQQWSGQSFGPLDFSSCNFSALFNWSNTASVNLPSLWLIIQIEASVLSHPESSP